MRTPLRVAVVLPALLLLMSLEVRSQDVDPPTLPYSGTTAQRSAVVRQQPARFLFAWGSGAIPQYRSISDSLGINAVLMYPWYGLNEALLHQRIQAEFRQMPDSSLLLFSNWRTEGATPSGYRRAIAMQYDPTEANTVVGWNGFEPRVYDTSGASFGFAYRHPMGIVPHDSVMTSADTANNPIVRAMKDNYNRYVLFASSYPSGQSSPLLVLSNPEPSTYLINPILTEGDFRHKQWALLRKRNRNLAVLDAERYGQRWWHWQDSLLRQSDSTVFRARGDSTEWWLALNLRRWRNDDQDVVADSTPVVSVRVPYRYRIDTVYYHRVDNQSVELFGNAEAIDQLMVIDSIRSGGVQYTRYATFDSTATLATGTTVHPVYGIMDNALAASATDRFVIRKGMLPAATTAPRPDVTLSSHFWLPRLARNDKWDITGERWNIAEPEYYKTASPAQVQVLLSHARQNLPSSGFALDTVVVSVGLEVSYHGTVDIGIDYARFEDRMARTILRGRRDSLFLERMERGQTQHLLEQTAWAVRAHVSWLQQCCVSCRMPQLLRQQPTGVRR